MLDFNHFPTQRNVNVQVFYGENGSGRPWVKPRGYSTVFFYLLSAGGGGGGGQTGVAGKIGRAHV